MGGNPLPGPGQQPVTSVVRPQRPNQRTTTGVITPIVVQEQTVEPVQLESREEDDDFFEPNRPEPRNPARGRGGRPVRPRGERPRQEEPRTEISRSQQANPDTQVTAPQPRQRPPRNPTSRQEQGPGPENPVPQTRLIRDG